MTRWFSSRSAGLYAGALVSLAAAITAAYWVPLELTRLEALGISFAHPRWLWLAALALGLPLLAPFGLTDLPKAQRALQVLVRAALVVLLAVAAAGPRSLQEVPRRVQILHLVDRSESVPDELLAAAAASARNTNQQVLKIEADQPTTDAADEERLPPVTVVAFDGDAERLPWPPTDTDAEAGDAVPSPVIARHPAAGRETDLAGALNVALGLLDGQSVPHIVIWSDGIETRGDASELVQTLKAAGVRVHTPALPPMPVQAEFLIERFELPPVVRANVAFPVAISVQSSAIARVSCRVKAPGQDLPPVTAQVQAGATRVELGLLRLKEGGTVELSASCDLVDGADRFAANNHLRARVIVRARPKILYVEGVATQAQQLARALGDDYEVDVRGGDGLPRNLAALKQFQAIILSDVPRVTPAGVQLLSDGDMRNLHAYAQQGGGLLVIGGENSLGSGGYQNTYLDKHVLPVQMDIESSVENPTIALMLLIDRSGSMSGSKMELAKEAARATAEAMAREDRIGVVAFDSEARTAVRLQRAGNRYRIATDISKLTPSGGTHIYPALEIAWQALQSTPAKIKHVIVLTDGQAPRAGIDPLVRQMRRGGITVSSVGIGADVDRSLLEMIADRGGGRAYFTDRPETLPRIFVKETKLIAGDPLVETAIRARRVAGGRVDLLRGVAIDNAPVLTGLVPSKVKPGAEELVRASTGQPLLVRWRLGLGKVTVWTSDLKGRWAAAWIGWPGYPIFARQLVRDLLQEDLGLTATVRLARERDQLRIAADAIDEDDRYLQGLFGAAEVQLPNGSRLRLPLPEVAAGRYETTVPLADLGPYDVLVQLRASPDQPVLATGRATAVHPYPDEYRLPDPSGSSLEALVKGTGGRMGSGPTDWVDDGGATHRGWQWLWPDLVRWGLLLLLLDVGLRRVRLGRAPSIKWHTLRRK